MINEQSAAIWQQVSVLRPRLRRHIRVRPQVYRHEKWYVLHDETAGKFLRFNQSAYDLIGRFNGDLTIAEIVDSVNTRRTEEHQWEVEDVLLVLAQLHEFEALKGGLPMNARDALARFRRHRRSGFLKQWANPISMRIPLFDPDQLLNRLVVPARWLFSAAGFYVWLGLLLIAAILVGVNLNGLTAQIAEKAVSMPNLLGLLILYPVVKLLHEFGHGLAVKTWGGEVHETGVLLLIFFPIPYVDASAAWSFRDKRKRIIVSAAGIMVELALAAIGILVWSLSEPGLVNSLALDIAILGGLSTILYNGNPLLRFDGYYVLEDLTEIPNMGARSSRYYLYLAQRYLLGITNARSPVTAKGETRWFLVYGFLSPLYRLFVLLGISIYLAGQYLVVGVALAAFAVFKQVVQPVYSAIAFLVSDSREGYNRVRGISVTAFVIVLITLVMVVERPRVTRTQGVVSVPDSGQINAKHGGEIIQVLAATGDVVSQGDIIVRMKNREMESQLIALQAKVAELKTLAAQERQISRVRGKIAEANVTAVVSELQERQRLFDALSVKSPADGTLVFDNPHLHAGGYIQAGDTLAYVVQNDQSVVRAVVDQDSIGGFDAGVTGAEVVLANRPGVIINASVVRAVPAAGSRLPSRALGVPGGGPIPVSPADPSGLHAIHQVFQYDLSMPAGTAIAGIGERAYVRLTHGSERLWRQLFRRFQQLFLSQLGI